jgi:hypothetical protein
LILILILILVLVLFLTQLCFWTSLFFFCCIVVCDNNWWCRKGGAINTHTHLLLLYKTLLWRKQIFLKTMVICVLLLPLWWLWSDFWNNVVIILNSLI